jgi:hypothetical protein
MRARPCKEIRHLDSGRNLHDDRRNGPYQSPHRILRAIDRRLPIGIDVLHERFVTVEIKLDNVQERVREGPIPLLGSVTPNNQITR